MNEIKLVHLPLSQCFVNEMDCQFQITSKSNLFTSQSHNDNKIGFYLLEARTNPNSISLKEIFFFYSWLTVSIFLKIGRLLQFRDSTSFFPIFFLLCRQQIRLIFNLKGFVRENTSALIEYPLLGD